jgi:hypothetical protein
VAAEVVVLRVPALAHCIPRTVGLRLGLPTSRRDADGCAAAAASLGRLPLRVVVCRTLNGVLQLATDALPPSVEVLDVALPAVARDTQPSQLLPFRPPAPLVRLREVLADGRHCYWNSGAPGSVLPRRLEALSLTGGRFQGVLAPALAPLRLLRRLGLPRIFRGSVPDVIAALPTRLQRLAMRDIANDTTNDLSHLRWLTHLDVSGTLAFGNNDIAMLPLSLTHLAANRCPAITPGVSLDHLHRLHRLELVRCERLRRVEWLDAPDGLVEFEGGVWEEDVVPGAEGEVPVWGAAGWGGGGAAGAAAGGAGASSGGVGGSEGGGAV